MVKSAAHRRMVREAEQERAAARERVRKLAPELLGMVKAMFHVYADCPGVSDADVGAVRDLIQKAEGH
jgi:hypothetical protein